jgi:hypothetical protein
MSHFFFQGRLSFPHLPDRIHILLINYLLDRNFKPYCRKPAKMRLRPFALSRILLPMSQQKRSSLCLACPSMLFISSRARVKSLIASCSLAGTHTGVSSPDRCNRLSVLASLRSVFTRSPVFLGISDGATTSHCCPRSINCRYTP